MPNYHNMEAKNLRRTWLTYHWAVYVKNPDVLTCTVILSCYWFSSENPWESEPYRYVDARYIFIPGKGVYCISRKTKFYGGDFLAGIYLEKWKPAPHKQCFVLRKRCRDRVRMYVNNAIFAGRTDEAQIASAVNGHLLHDLYESMKIIETNLRFAWLDIRKKTNMIVVHHTGNPADDDLSAEEIHASYKAQGWSGIGYHYVIRKNGSIERGRTHIGPSVHMPMAKIAIPSVSMYAEILKSPSLQLSRLKRYLCL